MSNIFSSVYSCWTKTTLCTICTKYTYQCRSSISSVKFHSLLFPLMLFPLLSPSYQVTRMPPTVWHYLFVVASTYNYFPPVYVGNAAWFLRRGLSSGETQCCKFSSNTGKSVIAHPIDCQYETSTSEGWPLLVCEVVVIPNLKQK